MPLSWFMIFIFMPTSCDRAMIKDRIKWLSMLLTFTSRYQPVSMKNQAKNQLRGILKTFGLVVVKAGGKLFEKRGREIRAEQPGLDVVIDSILEVPRCITL